MILTHPGKIGDLLWALPTVRGFAARHGAVTLALPEALAAAVGPLLQYAPYLQGGVIAVPEADWPVQDTAPRSPVSPTEGWIRERGDLVINLGLAAWPRLPLPYEYADQARSLGVLQPYTVDFTQPWLTVPPEDRYAASSPLVVAWTDRWFELKLGILADLQRPVELFVQPGSRMAQVELPHVSLYHCTLHHAAQVLADPSVRALLTDNSAFMVLGAALGVPTVVVEPEEARQAAVFNPSGFTCQLLLGGDQRPTFDSRHVRETVATLLADPLWIRGA